MKDTKAKTTNLQREKKIEYKCRLCGKTMEKTFAIGLGLETPYYCNNNKCEKFGDLTISGVKNENK